MTDHGAPLVLVTGSCTPEQLARLRAIAPAARFIQSADIETDPDLLPRVQVCYPSLSEAQWEKAVGLAWMQSNWTGVDALLARPAVRAHPAIITNVHVQPQSICEHLWGMTLSLSRNLHVSARLQASATWDNAAATRGLATLAGKWLCIVGMGAIGERCAAVGKSLGMRVIGISRRGLPHPLADEMMLPDKRLEAFARARVVMMLLPGTPETRGFVGARELAVMDSAFLLNAGRGTAIVTPALVEALDSGHLRGVGLDVTDPEPLPADHPLWSRPDVLITPHYAGLHPGYDAEAFEVFADNLGRWVRGEPLRNVVDRLLGY